MIKLITANRVLHLRATANETIRDALNRHRVPISAVHITEEFKNGITSIHGWQRVSDVRGKIVAYANRNIQLDEIVNSKTSVLTDEDSSTSYVGPSQSTLGSFDRSVIELSPERVVDLATKSIKEVHSTYLIDAARFSRCVVGYSGGGDSNLLLTALAESGLFAEGALQPVMVLGIRDWDKQLETAQRLSSELGMRLTVIDTQRAAALAGLDSLDATLVRYGKAFPGTSKEFFGTWLLRKVLTSYCKTADTNCLMLGGNREDSLAESMYLISRGQLPLRYPVREVGGISIVNPLYRLPKKVIDGAYATYSMQNYINRDPNVDYGRSAFYYLAYLIEDNLPGLDVDLLQGMSALSANDVEWDEQLQDYVHSTAPTELRDKWKAVLGRGQK